MLQLRTDLQYRQSDYGCLLYTSREAGIKVLDWDTPATEDLVDASIHQISDKELGEHCVDKLVEYMGTEEGEYAIITGGLSAANLNAWIKYAREYAEEKFPNLKLVADPYPTDEKQDVALSTAKDVMKAYPDLKGFILSLIHIYLFYTPDQLIILSGVHKTEPHVFIVQEREGGTVADHHTVADTGVEDILSGYGVF